MGQPNYKSNIINSNQLQKARLAQLEAEAARLGIQPFDANEDMRGDFWPEDESIDDFLAAVRQWRKTPARRKS